MQLWNILMFSMCVYVHVCSIYSMLYFQGETSQSDGQDNPEERLRRRSRTPGNKEGYLLGDEAIFNEMVKMEGGVDIIKSKFFYWYYFFLTQGGKCFQPSDIFTRRHEKRIQCVIITEL